MKTFIAQLLLASAAIAQEAQPPAAESAPPAPVPEAAPATLERAASSSALPEPFIEGRYDPTFTRNPFLIKTVATPGPQGPGWQEDWELASHFGKGDQQRVTLKNNKTGEFKRVTMQPDKDDFRIIKVTPSRKRSEFVVDIGKGNETGSIKFPTTAAAPQPGVVGSNLPRANNIPGAPPAIPNPGGMAPNNGRTGSIRPNPTARPGTATPSYNGQPGYPGQPNMHPNMQPGYPAGNNGTITVPGTIAPNNNGGANIQGAGSVPNPSNRRRVLLPPQQAPQQ